MKAYAVKIDPKKPDAKIIARAAGIIKKGGLVVFPTETVYGIAANMLDEKAIAKLHSMKGERGAKPFTVHISDMKMIKEMGCDITPEALLLIKKYWPGPLTIILKSADGRKTGFRMPASKIALELIGACGVPVAAPSANVSGGRPPLSAGELATEFGDKADMILDGGRAEVGIESTVIDLTVRPAKILREGAITPEELKEALDG